MSEKLERGIAVWGAAFFTLEFLAIFWRGCPWPTLSSTVTGIIRAWPPEGWLVAAFMLILYAHFRWGWSPRWLVLIAVLGLLLYLGHRSFDLP